MRLHRLLAGVLAVSIASVGVVSISVDRSDAVLSASVVTDGWEWQVLDGESTLFGLVTAPVIADLGGFGERASSPPLRAPELGVPLNLLSPSRWTFAVSSIDQPVADGPVTVTATASGAGGSAAVTAIVDGGSVEYTVVLADSLTGLIGLDYDPQPDGYREGALIVEQGGSTQTEIGGWLAGSTTHHAYAWALDQLDTDTNQNWVTFVVQAAGTSGAESDPTLFPAATSDGLIRAIILADGVTGLASPADTLIVRVTLQGGVGCAVDPAPLADLAVALRTTIADGSLADDLGCLEIAPITATVSEPLDVTVPIALDLALESTAWRQIMGAERMAIGELPDGLDAQLIRSGSELRLRVVGTPTQPSTTEVELAIGADSASVGVDLIDAVRGSVSITVRPALAATGPDGALGFALLSVLLVAGGVVITVMRGRPRSS